MQLNQVQQAALAQFPVIKKALQEKIQAGYKLRKFSYESMEMTNHETLYITLEKGYETFFLRQSKGSYASNGYSHPMFGREGERGEFIDTEMIENDRYLVTRGGQLDTEKYLSVNRNGL